MIVYMANCLQSFLNTSVMRYICAQFYIFIIIINKIILLNIAIVIGPVFSLALYVFNYITNNALLKFFNSTCI